MHILRFTIVSILLSVLVVGFGFYAYGVMQGDMPPPDPEKLKAWVQSLAVGGSAIGILVMAALVLLAAIAPVIYAARSGDGFTILFSVVTLLLVVALLVTSRTIIDMVLAAIVYFTSAIVAVIVFSTARIAGSLTTPAAGLLANVSREQTRGTTR